KAIGYYEKALRMDPGYALAWAGLADARARQAASGYAAITEAYEHARRDVAKALELDPNLPEAHAALGYIRFNDDWDWTGAAAAYARALALEPGNADAIRHVSNLAATLGRFDEALRLARRAVELDPLSVAAYTHLGLTALRDGKLDDAEAALRKALELNPQYPSGHQSLGRVFLMRKQAGKALAEMQQEPEPVWRLQGLALAYHAL